MADLGDAELEAWIAAKFILALKRLFKRPPPEDHPQADRSDEGPTGIGTSRMEGDNRADGRPGEDNGL